VCDTDIDRKLFSQYRPRRTLGFVEPDSSKLTWPRASTVWRLFVSRLACTPEADSGKLRALSASHRPVLKKPNCLILALRRLAQRKPDSGVGLGFWLSGSSTGVINRIMSPALLTPEKECYTVLILQFFRETLIRAESMFSL
jgi:hypothetical protein